MAHRTVYGLPAEMKNAL